MRICPKHFLNSFRPNNWLPEPARCYAYRVGFQPVDGVEKYKLVSSVTITNHSGYLPGSPHCKGPDLCPFGPGPSVDLNVDPDWQLDSDISTYDTGEEILLLQTPTITETPTLAIIEETPIPTDNPATLVPPPAEIIELPTEVLLFTFPRKRLRRRPRSRPFSSRRMFRQSLQSKKNRLRRSLKTLRCPEGVGAIGWVCQKLACSPTCICHLINNLTRTYIEKSCIAVTSLAIRSA